MHLGLDKIRPAWSEQLGNLPLTWTSLHSTRLTRNVGFWSARFIRSEAKASHWSAVLFGVDNPWIVCGLRRAGAISIERFYIDSLKVLHIAWFKGCLPWGGSWRSWKWRDTSHMFLCHVCAQVQDRVFLPGRTLNVWQHIYACLYYCLLRWW